MIYSGETLSVSISGNGVARLVFDRQSGSVNKFDDLAVSELTEALDKLEAAASVTGLIISSAKNVFVVGADITEFIPQFKQPEKMAGFLKVQSDNFLRLEQLDYPVIVAINGFALGGGLEVCLAGDVRVASELATVGLPETGLGIIPGWGGTVRLPRLIGVNTALEWITSGKPKNALVALEAGVVDFVVNADNLIEKAEEILEACQSGEYDYRASRTDKNTTRAEVKAEAADISDQWLATVDSKYGKRLPAQGIATNSVLSSLDKPLEEALEIERNCFVEAAKTDQAKALVGNFLSDQYLMKLAKQRAKNISAPTLKAGVLGAGIMGGGIAYQSALTGTPVVMKDIAQDGLDLGMGEAEKLLDKQVSRGRMNEEKKTAVLSAITPTLDYDENFNSVDLIVEAVVENIKVKHIVLTEVETTMNPKSIVCSNTSTIPITDLAKPLARPEQFCGMHFFNPVHAMPLVEVIRGEKTSDDTINKTVAYALALKKKPVVVNDCPAFLVNRLLFAYYAGFLRLVQDGADYEEIDKAMEQWGWPMGPAYLADVIGMDTMQHCDDVISEAYSKRMKRDFPSWYQLVIDEGGLGQKNGKGFYQYSIVDGRPAKTVNSVVKDKIAALAKPSKVFSQEEIIDRMMIPLGIEMAFALEEKIVESPEEGDIALLYGVGFPAFKGGAARWMDSIGLKDFCDLADTYAEKLGALYEVTDVQRDMATRGASYYS